MKTSTTPVSFPFWKLLILHLYPGIIILGFYSAIAPILVHYRYPPMLALLGAEVMILLPLALLHLREWTTPFNNKPPLGRLILWVVLGFVACVVLYAPMFPAGLWIRAQLFSWLPNWFYDPGFAWAEKNALILTFSLGIIIDGLIGPVVEEFYFRGFLLPSMSHLGKLAPPIHAILFTVYHFWQPHNYMAILGVSLVLTYSAWWKKSIWISIGIHCLVNIVGSLTGLAAAIGGVTPY